MKNSKPSLCFVALSAWPVLSGDRNIHSVGGAEVQQCILARNFVKQGYKVTMICMDYGQADGVVVDGVLVLKAHRPNGGLPFLRFIHPRFTSVWWAMRRANADMYYQRAAGVHTGYTALFCHMFGRKFIYAAAHDADFDLALPLIKYQRGKKIYAWGLRKAHLVFVQNPTQLDSYWNLHGKKAVLMKNCYSLPVNATINKNGYVLWVSTLRKWKRPDLFIKLAKCLPQYQFRMVGGSAGDLNFEELKQEAAALHNLEFIGFVPHAEIEEQFDGARLFVNTSEYEGFPNTFLQSWARGIPTVSFIDTGSVLEGRPVINRVNSLEDMVQLVDYLMNDNESWEEVGRRSMQYYAEEHSIEGVINKYTEIFYDLNKNKCDILTE